MAFIAATSDSDKLRLAGLSALQVHSTVAGQGIVVVVVVVVAVGAAAAAMLSLALLQHCASRSYLYTTVPQIIFIHQLTTVVAL